MVLLFQCFQVIINFQYEKSIHISVKGYPKTTVWFEERVYGSRPGNQILCDIVTMAPFYDFAENLSSLLLICDLRAS